MQIFKGAHPYRQQGHNTANYFTAPGGVEGGEHYSCSLLKEDHADII